MKASWVLLTVVLASTAGAARPAAATEGDTLFVELGRSNRGCVFQDGERIWGPIYVVSASFTTDKDSLFLGLAINRFIPRVLRNPAPQSRDITPKAARRMAFVWTRSLLLARVPHLMQLGMAHRLRERGDWVSSVELDTTSTEGLMTVHWKDDPEPWTFRMADARDYPPIQSPQSDGMALLNQARIPITALQRVNRIDYSSTKETRITTEPCSPVETAK